MIKLVTKKKAKKGLRVYNKYYLKGTTETPKIIHPGLLDLFEFGIKRVAVEAVLRQRTKKLEKFFFHPDGLLMTPSHKTIDLFKKLTEIPTKYLPDVVLEAACHPATCVDDLPETKMRQTRVDEYKFLKSDAFVSLSNRLQFVSYSQLA